MKQFFLRARIKSFTNSQIPNEPIKYSMIQKIGQFVQPNKPVGIPLYTIYTHQTEPKHRSFI